MSLVTQKEVEQFLRKKGIRPSYLRIKILEYFLVHHNHPSVNMIYEALGDAIPSLSKTSVYNTVSLYVQHNILEALGITANEQRYDLYRPKTHAHFLCEQCGKIWDVNLSHLEEDLTKQFSDFLIKSQSLQFTGVCPCCISGKTGTEGASSESKESVDKKSDGNESGPTEAVS